VIADEHTLGQRPAAGNQVFAINPKSAARYCGRHSSSGQPDRM
jgi:hypothetical protein